MAHALRNGNFYMKYVDQYTRRVITAIFNGTLKPEKVGEVLEYLGGDVVVGRKAMVVYGVVFEGGDEIAGLGRVSDIIERAWSKVK